MEGVLCHLDEVVRRGGGFPNQVGHLNIGGSLPSHEFKPPPTIISTPQTTSHLAILPLGFWASFFAIKVGFCSSIRRMHRTSVILYCCYIDEYNSDFGGPLCVMRWLLTSIEVTLLNFWIVFFLLLKIAIRSSLKGHPKTNRVGIYGCNLLNGIFIARDRRVVVHIQLYFNSFSFPIF